MAACARKDHIVRMFDARRGEQLEAASGADDEPEREVTGWRNYATVVVRRLARNFPDASIGADIVFASDLPSASGMSSSSALMVGLATARVAVSALDDRVEWHDNIRGLDDQAGYYACIENGMSFGSLAGDQGVGTHGGSEDHVAILCGEPGHVSAWRFVPIHHVASPAVPDDWTFVIAASGVAADKTGAAKESYNRLSREARTLLDLWNAHESRVTSLRLALSSSDKPLERLEHLVQAAPFAGTTAADLGRRLRHFVREDARVLEATEGLRNADLPRLSALTDASQADAETLLRNQVPETIALARSARDLGAFAASSFGAGFGGSVWALVNRGAALAFQERWLNSYRQEFPSRTNASAFIARPGPPLTRLI
jgi:galactokinase